MISGNCDAGRCDSRQAHLAYHLGLDPGYAWTRRSIVLRTRRRAIHSTCTACWGVDLPHNSEGHRLHQPGPNRHGRRIRPAAAREAVVEAPSPSAADHRLNGNSPSQHQAALAATVLHDATQQAVQSSRQWLPEAFELEAGEVSAVHRDGLDSLADVFRCSGCSLPECQVRPSTCRASGSTVDTAVGRSLMWRRQAHVRAPFL